ncbi:ABC transporter ATP-binding protein [Corallococcus macrosporus]|uniref:ABC transporter ATP-binding protein n=1 Tax=Corallococcus macrosporus TaxID=35 RepID=A0ABS3DIJ4_9BACT|nr:ABC transporter ATP-binding protein [Corallococcus macrosporus]MBN8231139.1 ABC transporter ATP-binding protein [Corallococcus macrosporus]
MSLLEVKGLRRDYGALRAVDNVSFNLEAGSILGFIGPNGAGKSTTLRILATLDVPTSGTVLLDGTSLVDAPDRARPLLGYMPDRYGTYDDITVKEFLDFFARAYGLKGAQRKQRVDSVMEFTGLGPLAEKLTTELSKGMRQRVALGRTLLHDPRLLLLDEPADGLDPRARIELRELLRALADQGKAVIISSHILTELAEICDSCVIIEQGRLLAQGKVEDLLRQSAGPSRVTELTVRLAAAGDEGEALWARTERTLLEQPRVKDVSREGGALRVRLELEADAGPAQAEAAAAVLLAALVAQGLPVCAFSPRERNLEDAFMTVTKGRVA